MTRMLLDILLGILPLITAEVVGLLLVSIVARSSFANLPRGYLLALAFGLGTGVLSLVQFSWLLIPGTGFAGLVADLSVGTLLALILLCFNDCHLLRVVKPTWRFALMDASARG